MQRVFAPGCALLTHIGGKHPHYLVDLLFGEETHPGTWEPDQWHQELDEFISVH